MTLQIPLPDTEPGMDCALCPRLAALRGDTQRDHPDWWNAPVPTWGDPAAWLAVIGLAPGRLGAHRTGRPITGDDAGGMLFETMTRHGLAIGTYKERADDGLRMEGAIILNAVKCLPPGNKPNAQEIAQCRPFLTEQLAALPALRVVIALGRIAHDSFLKSQGLKLADYPFSHGAQNRLPNGMVLIDSYHCSRYNTNTRRLTQPMFDAVFVAALAARHTS